MRLERHTSDRIRVNVTKVQIQKKGIRIEIRTYTQVSREGFYPLSRSYKSSLDRHTSDLCKS